MTILLINPYNAAAPSGVGLMGLARTFPASE